MSKIYIQGTFGAYSHLAALEIDPNAEVIPCKTFDECFLKTSSESGSRMLIPESNRITGNIGIGTDSPNAALNIVRSALSNQFRVSNTENDATTKYGAIVGSHYTNAEEPITGMLMTSSSSCFLSNMTLLIDSSSFPKTCPTFCSMTRVRETTIFKLPRRG